MPNMQTINVTITFDPDDDHEFKRIIEHFGDSKTDFVKWVWIMCMGTSWEAAYILANEYIADDEQLHVFLKHYFSGSTNADEIFRDLLNFANDKYSGVINGLH